MKSSEERHSAAWEFWFPLCFGGLLVFLLFYWEENLKVAEAAYCSLSIWEGGIVRSIAKTLDSLDSRKSLHLTVLSDLTCPPQFNNLSTQKSPAWKWERILIFSWNSCRKTFVHLPLPVNIVEYFFQNKSMIPWLHQCTAETPSFKENVIL